MALWLMDLSSLWLIGFPQDIVFFFHMLSPFNHKRTRTQIYIYIHIYIYITKMLHPCDCWLYHSCHLAIKHGIDKSSIYRLFSHAYLAEFSQLPTFECTVNSSLDWIIQFNIQHQRMHANSSSILQNSLAIATKSIAIWSYDYDHH